MMSNDRYDAENDQRQFPVDHEHECYREDHADDGPGYIKQAPGHQF